MTIEMINECARCRVCEDAAYQAPPVAYVGDFDSPILVVAQNPGEIKSGDLVRKATARNMLLKANRTTADSDISDVILGWYFEDFTTSPGYKEMSKLFGKDWLLSGIYLYTNAVRCRTQFNKSPSSQMQTECWKYTRQLLFDREAVVMIGSVAKQQVCGTMKLTKSVATLVDGKYYLYIPHYVRWTAPKIEAYQYALRSILDEKL